MFLFLRTLVWDAVTVDRCHCSCCHCSRRHHSLQAATAIIMVDVVTVAAAALALAVRAAALERSLVSFPSGSSTRSCIIIEVAQLLVVLLSLFGSVKY